MRLIDADALIEFIDAGHLRHPSELCFSELDVVNMLNHAPIAYDVDAVVKELEESTVCGMFGAMFGKSDTEIIDIIRKGGVKRDFLLGSYNR